MNLQENIQRIREMMGLLTEGPGGQTTDGCGPGFNKHPFLTGSCIPNGWVAPKKVQSGPTVDAMKDLDKKIATNYNDKIVAQQIANGAYLERNTDHQQAEFRVNRSNKYPGLVTKNNTPKIDPYPFIIDREKKIKNAEKSEDLINYYKQNAHTINTIFQIGTAFIPLVGPFISAGIGLADAKMYYDEGDKKTAGLVAVFSFIPGVGGLANKLGLTKWTAKTLGEIGKKISIGSKLLPQEIKVVNIIAKNKQLIQSEMAKIGETATIKSGSKMAREILKKEKQKQFIKTQAKTLATYGAAYGGYSKGYDYVQRDTPKTKAENESLDWEYVKTSFGSSGSKEDNDLLNNAWDGGWRPGTHPPKQFQTALYQKENNEEQENLKKLQAMIASNPK